MLILRGNQCLAREYQRGNKSGGSRREGDDRVQVKINNVQVTLIKVGGLNWYVAINPTKISKTVRLLYSNMVGGANP